MKLLEAIAKAKADSPKRNFKQSVELFVNFANLDFNKAENKLSLEIVLPKGRGRPSKIAVIAGDELASSAKRGADTVIMGNELEGLGKDKKRLKSVASEHGAFLSQISLMAAVGKHLGQVLGPRGKMPKPVPPNIEVRPIAERLRNTVYLRTKGKNLPVLHVPIGTADMSDDDLEANANAVLSALRAKLPQGDANIRNVRVKLSMGPGILAEVAG
jgi:large subunit ribosomal protein L1